MGQADAEPRGGQQVTPSLTRSGKVQRGLQLAIALLVAKRLAYHLTYLVGDPFALATFSDGQLYEIAARDIVAHPLLGSEPFYLQGLYAYLLALPLAITDQVVIGLLIQLVIAAGALWLLHRTAVSMLGETAGALSTLVLLGYHELAFYENKYLSVSLGASCNALALWAAVRCLQRPSGRALLGAGAAAGLAMLARPNMIVAVPFTAAALYLAARGADRPTSRTLLAFAAGVALALAPMALRNQIVTGRPDVQPSHSGGIPFFIGNNPAANGRWNTAGGLISGQVGRERVELAQHLGLTLEDGAELDRAVGDAMRARALRFIRDRPADWLALELKKLWLTLGNHRFVRDYDARGEAELIGGFWSAVALPFGVLLGLGALGLHALFRRAVRVRAERARWLALLLVLGGQLFAVLSANLLIFQLGAEPPAAVHPARLRGRPRTACRVGAGAAHAASDLAGAAARARRRRAACGAGVHPQVGARRPPDVGALLQPGRGRGGDRPAAAGRRALPARGRTQPEAADVSSQSRACPASPRAWRRCAGGAR